MLKIFTLAITVSLFPLSQRVKPADEFIKDHLTAPAFSFHFKEQVSSPFFEPEKKSTEAWSQNWAAAAQENIRQSEYHFNWEEKIKAYCTPNRKNNLRFFYDENGFTVEPRTTKIPVGEYDPSIMPDEIKYRTIPNWKVKFKLDEKQVGKGTWVVTENQAAYITDKLTVQYINNDEGMRQNFIVHQPLSKCNELTINLNIKTTLKKKLSQNQLQFYHKKNNVLNYKDLKVWDATGRSLTAFFKKGKKGIYYIQVDTKEAVYPITIDPLSTTPAAIVESNQDGARLGYSVASAGDVNGDGYSDVIVGATAYDNGQADEGAAFVYHGSVTGINTTAAAILECNQVSAFMGYSLASAGDVNGDGYSDVIVGAYVYDNGQEDEGAAFIYHGSATGINTTVAAIVDSDQATARLGSSVAGAGDVNGDGFSDVIVGSYLYDNGQFDEGTAFVYHGSVTGINTTMAATFESNQISARMGSSVASAGDVNGDGYSDVIVGAYLYDNGQNDEGYAFVYHGSATGLNLTAATTVESNQVSVWMGLSVACAGDVNGDGYSDVIVGSHLYSNGQSNEGCAFVYHGSATGINNVAVATLEGNQVSAYLGYSVASAGDINGDGYSDVIVGAFLYDNGEANEGAAFVYHGSLGGINTTAVSIVESNQAEARMGLSAASAGDVNGDGYSDVIVGAYFYDNGQTDEGAAFVYHGAASGINTSAAAMVESNQVSALMGWSVASAGDINADGYSDVVVGVRGYDGGQTDEGAVYIYHGSISGLNSTPAAIIQSNHTNANFGYSVASAGDVNGDGYSDVITGGYGYSNAQTNEGAAFVYHGSATGINTTAAVFLESNQASAFMGTSVASAGDVNGDGYSDIIVGAYAYDNGQADEGVAFIYHGSSTGINSTATSITERNQAGARMGSSVASAGDVNGDGYSDIIIGAVLFNNGQSAEGAAFIYHGTSTGIGITAAAVLDANQADSRYGNSVACAGDVNGDGYADVIVGAYQFDNGQTDEGVAFIYHGASGGINTSAAVAIESNQAFGSLGVSVAGAGDLNGDGYSDIIVGADTYDNGQTDEGVAFTYHGSFTGIITTPAAMMQSNQADARFGYSVAGAGDVNGDGFSDIIAGAYSYDNAQSNEGAAFVYQGNSPGNNKRNNLRLYNTNLTTRINSSNFVFGNFGAGLYAKSFLGRSKGKLVWETRLNYNAYSGTPITNSTFFTAQQSAYTDMGLAGIELKNIIQKINGGLYTKLRARIKYDPVTAITGQVYSPWRNVSSIIDANNMGALPIELISFNAAWLQKGKTVKLSFITDKESGICCFDIEKSLDGFNFFTIGTIPAKNISGIQSYTFMDGNATRKKQFYRLKIKGIAGQISYSNIQQLQNDKATEILIFPNPTTDVLQLQLNAAYDKMHVQVINSAGQLVKQLTLRASNQTITIPVQNLAAGKYWLHLQSGDEKQVLQFVKQ